MSYTEIVREPDGSFRVNESPGTPHFSSISFGAPSRQFTRKRGMNPVESTLPNLTSYSSGLLALTPWVIAMSQFGGTITCA